MLLKDEKNQRKRSEFFELIKKGMMGVYRKLHKKFSSKELRLVDFDSTFNLALWTNILRFKEDKKCSFRTYAYRDIKMTIIDEVNKARSMLKIPTRTARKVYMVKEDDWFNLFDNAVQSKYRLTKYEVDGIIDRPYAFYRDVKLEDRDELLGDEDDEFELYGDEDTEIEGVED